MDRISPTRRITPRSMGSIFLNEFQAFSNTCFVLALLFTSDIIKNIIAIRYIAPLNM
jgi:hypothetical protein